MPPHLGAGVTALVDARACARLNYAIRELYNLQTTDAPTVLTSFEA